MAVTGLPVVAIVRSIVTANLFYRATGIARSVTTTSSQEMCFAENVERRER